jgi:hypothetical protein
MFKWIEDLIGSNDGQGRKAKNCSCENLGEHSGTEFSGSADMTFGNTPPTCGPTHSHTMPKNETDIEGEKAPSTVTITMLVVNGTEIVKDKVVEWDFSEDEDTGRVSISLTLEDGTQQEFIFMRNWLSYVTTA